MPWEYFNQTLNKYVPHGDKLKEYTNTKDF